MKDSNYTKILNHKSTIKSLAKLKELAWNAQQSHLDYFGWINRVHGIFSSLKFSKMSNLKMNKIVQLQWLQTKLHLLLEEINLTLSVFPRNHTPPYIVEIYFEINIWIWLTLLKIRCILLYSNHFEVSSVIRSHSNISQVICYSKSLAPNCLKGWEKN